MVAFYNQPRTTFQVHDIVAVVRRLPWGRDVLKLTKIKHIGDRLIDTVDSGSFSAADGESMGGRFVSYIELASPGHLLAMRRHRMMR